MRAHTWPAIGSLQHPRFRIHLGLVFRPGCCTILRIDILDRSKPWRLCYYMALRQIAVFPELAVRCCCVFRSQVSLKGRSLGGPSMSVCRRRRAERTLGRGEDCLRRGLGGWTPGIVLALRLALIAGLAWVLAIALGVLASIFSLKVTS